MKKQFWSFSTVLAAAALLIGRPLASAQPPATPKPPAAATPHSASPPAEHGGNTGDLSLIPATIPIDTPEGIILGGGGDLVVVYQDAGSVRRESPDRRAKWVTPLAGRIGRVPDPQVVADADRAFVAHQDGVTALDVRTGKVLWHSPGPSGRMLLSGDLLLAADWASNEPTGGRWLVARRTPTGKEAFRVALPLKDFDALPILEGAGWFVVQTREPPGGKGDALLFDRAGQVRHRIDRQVVAVCAAEKDRLVLTSRDVIRLGADSPPRWTDPFAGREWIAGGGLVPLSGGDVVAYLYGAIADSGVQVLRLDPRTGRKRWEVICHGLGVSHSKYRHLAVVEVRGRTLKVTSRGSYGTFVEALDAQTGRSLARRVIDQ